MSALAISTFGVAEMGDGRRCHAVDFSREREIDREDERVAADLARELLQFLSRAGNERELGALRSEQPGNRPPMPELAPVTMTTFPSIDCFTNDPFLLTYRAGTTRPAERSLRWLPLRDCQAAHASGAGGFIAPVMIATASDIEYFFGSITAMRRRAGECGCGRRPRRHAACCG